MKKIYALAAALALGFSLPAFAQTASAPDSKVQADVKTTDHAKEKSSEAKQPQPVAQHPSGKQDSKTGAMGDTSGK